MTALAPHLTTFLCKHLPAERAASPHTCDTYAYCFQLLVCFAAVYLNHHYLLDILIGLGIALAVMAVARLAFGAVEVRRSPAEEEEPGLAAART